MTIQEKVSQLVQGDIRNYLNLTDGSLNQTGLEWSMATRGHAVWSGLYAKPEIIKLGAQIAQDYQMNQTELGEQRSGRNLFPSRRHFFLMMRKQQASRPTSQAKVCTGSSP
jgi:hypothetical protein